MGRDNRGVRSEDSAPGQARAGAVPGRLGSWVITDEGGCFSPASQVCS